MSNWKEYRISEVAIVVDCEHKTAPTVQSSEYISVRTTNISNGRIDFDNANRVSPKTYKEWTKRTQPKYRDIVFAREAPVGEAGWIPKERNVCLGQRTVLIRCNESLVNSRYLMYYLTSPSVKNELIQRSTGSVVQHLNVKDIKEFGINIHSDLYEQTAIASILSSLDDKIELNNQINQELEALAQALFKHWFIDFEFPISAAEATSMGKPNFAGQPYKSSGGEMVESELGEIPKGWSVQVLDDISTINIGRTPPRKEHEWFTENSTDVKWISIRDMGNCGVYIYDTSEYLTEEAVQKFNIPIIEPNTVILSFKLTVGRVSISTDRMLSNEAIAHINLKNKSLHPEFIYLYLKQFNYDSLGSTSSIATAVNSKSIKSIPIIIPDKLQLALFEKALKDSFQCILNNTLEIRELVSLRDILLPKLISGELEVSKAVAEKAI